MFEYIKFKKFYSRYMWHLFTIHSIKKNEENASERVVPGRTKRDKMSTA